jgi:hypothetical protein
VVPSFCFPGTGPMLRGGASRPSPSRRDKEVLSYKCHGGFRKSNTWSGFTRAFLSLAPAIPWPQAIFHYFLFPPHALLMHSPNYTFSPSLGVQSCRPKSSTEERITCLQGAKYMRKGILLVHLCSKKILKLPRKGACSTASSFDDKCLQSNLLSTSPCSCSQTSQSRVEDR